MPRPSPRLRRIVLVLGALAALLGLPSAAQAATRPASAATAAVSPAAAEAPAAPAAGGASRGVPSPAGAVLDTVLRPSAPPRAATTGGVCQVPGIGDIGGLLGFCSLGSSGLIGDLNNVCQPALPTPEPATGGINALIKPVAPAVHQGPTLYDAYGVAGQSWAAYDLQCSDMASLIGNNVASVVFDAAKALDRVTITVYQSAAGQGILGWLTGAVNRLITSLGNAIYFPYLAPVIIIGAIWLAWQGLIRKRATRTIEGTLWMVVACAAAIWLIARPADFTGFGRTVSDGITQTLNVAFGKLPSPHQSSCVPLGHSDPQSPPVANYGYSSGNGVVDTNANELWTVLVCKPWLDGEFGTTAYSASPGAHPTVVNTYGRSLLWAQAVAANEKPTPALIQAKQDAYAGIASSLKQHDPTAYSLFQGKQWTTRLEIAFAALFAALIAGVLVLLIAITLIILKLGFLLLLVVGPFFLIIGTHPGFGRVVALRWLEMLVGVLLKQAAVALVLSVLLYTYSLIMGTSDADLSWALKILMISLVTVVVFIYRKPFTHLFSAVGYGMIGSREQSATSLARARQVAGRNTLDAATVAVPGFAAYRAARWARRNPAQAAGLAAQAATSGSAGSTVAAGAGQAAGTGGGGTAPVAAGQAGGGGAGQDGAADGARRGAGGPGAPGRGRVRADAGGASAGRTPPPLDLPARGSAGPPSSGWARGGTEGTAAGRGRPAPVPRPRSGGSPAPGGSRGAAPGQGGAGQPPGGTRPSRPPRQPGAPAGTGRGGGAAGAGREARGVPFWLRPLRRRDGPRP